MKDQNFVIANLKKLSNMFTFKAKHGSKVQNILLYKDMQMSEFMNSLHAL